MQRKSLAAWLEYLEQGQPGGIIEMGLGRIAAVRDAMALKPRCPLIVVGGTNGKGSVCAFLTAIYRAAGFSAGTLTSPHLHRYNERIALNGTPVGDETITAAFEKIETARGSVHLSYFEFNILAAVSIFDAANVDVMILEVGMGGRLDAVNIFDADVAVITSVDLDHQAFLGDTVEKVAQEKAGIFRSGQYAVIGQNPVPQTMAAHAAALGTEILSIGKDFAAQPAENRQQWSFLFHPQNLSGSRRLREHRRHALPMPVLRGHYQLSNAACALAAAECLAQRLPVNIGAVKRGLLEAENPARFQVLPGRPTTVWDVGHNPHAARALRHNLILLPFARTRYAVFSILADKDIAGVVGCLKDQFDFWFIAPLDVPRAADVVSIKKIMENQGIDSESIREFPDIQAAYSAALSAAGEDDRIVAFGSFHTIAALPLQP